MSISQEERSAIVEMKIEKAYRAYTEAKGVVALGYWETIANRLYYAAYNAATALLVANGDDAQTHSGIIRLFGLRFIKPGLLPPEMARILHQLFALRQTGDYDDAYAVTEADVLPHIEPAGKFIDSVVALARKKLPDSNLPPAARA